MIVDLQYIVKSLESNEFILHVSNPKEKVDLRLENKGRDDCMNMLKMRFVNLSKLRTLQLYGIPKPSLKDFKFNNSSQLDNSPD